LKHTVTEVCGEVKELIMFLRINILKKSFFFISSHHFLCALTIKHNNVAKNINNQRRENITKLVHNNNRKNVSRVRK
jgi:hypothetical protein